MTAQILTPRESYGVDYPAAIEFAIKQAEIAWFAHEVEVEKDIHELKTNCTEAEYFGIVNTLKIFVHYEIHVGNNYWRDYIPRFFPRPDVQRVASVHAMTELNIHAPFYFKINELLGLNTDEFMNSYQEDVILADRLDWMERVVSKHETTMEKLTSVAIFSMIEGAVLYSSFAFLKHFNSDGKNKFQNINAGINFSAIDEDIHARTGAWIFNTALHEALNDADEYINLDTLYNDLEVTAWIIAENERDIVRKMFEFGSIEGITPLMLDNFVQSRLDICLTRLGAKTLFEPSYNPIADWFYDDIESSTLHDTFIAMGNDYKRNWTESKFIWKVKND